jgi:DNA-binding transcriptional LysR family regulator
VPGFEGRTGLKSRLLARDREMLLSGKARGLKPLKPVRLASFPALKLVVPGRQNVRRRNLDTYFATNGIAVAELIEMDAMTGTLEFVAASDWVTVLPSLICINDIAAADIVVSPIDPPLHAEFIVIEPARRVLSVQARLFLERLQAEVARIRGAWRAKLKGRR